MATRAPWYRRAYRWVRGTRGTQQLAQPSPRPLPARPNPARQYSFESDLERSRGLSTSALSLATLFTAYDEADNGWPATMIDLFEKRLEADAHLASIVNERLESVARKAWILEEGGDSDADKEAKQLLEDSLLRLGNFSATREHQLLATAYGWSLSEIDWQYVDGVVVPAGFANPAHRRFVFDEATDLPRLLTDLTDTDGVELTPGKWWYTRRRGRLASLAGLMRTACIWSLFKSVATRDWLIFADRFGIPYVTGEYAEGATDADKDILETAVSQLGSDGWAIMSEASNIILHETKGGGAGDVHGKLVALCDAQNSKLIAGATLLTETTGQASYAIGKVHQGRGFELKKGDAEWLSESFTECVSKPFCFYNGLAGKPPRLLIYLDLDVTILEFCKVASVCANELGMPLDEDQIRRKTTLRRPTGASLVGTIGGGENENEDPED